MGKHTIQKYFKGSPPVMYKDENNCCTTEPVLTGDIGPNEPCYEDCSCCPYMWE